MRNRVASLATAAAIAALWWLLSRSVVLTVLVVLHGLFETAQPPRPWREVGKDLLAASVWGGLVNLYLRIEWGYRVL